MIVETDQKVESNANKAAELASEALRLAEEAKKASQRLAEVKAALSLMTPVSSPRAQPFVAPEKETREASPTAAWRRSGARGGSRRSVAPHRRVPRASSACC